MVRVFVFLAAIQLVLFVLALISSLSADRVRAMPRAAWILVILLIPLLGPLAYFLWGRPLPARREGPIRRAPSRPLSPDDDPDFLRSVDTEQSRRDRELLAQWERDLDRDPKDQNRDLNRRDVGGRDVGGRDVSGHDLGGRDVGGRDASGHDLGGRDLGSDDRGRGLDEGARERKDSKREVDEGKREPGDS